MGVGAVPSSNLLHLLGDLKPLHVASFIGNDVILQSLISKLGVEEIEQPDNSGDRALHYAAIGDAYKSIHILLDHGAEINSRNNAGKTALHLAVKRENVSSCRKLLEAGAASSLRDSDGDSPLHYAILGHRDDLVSIFISHGADPGVTNQNGMNVLHLAAMCSAAGALSVILADCGLQNRVWLIDEQKDDGHCALHFAAMQSNEECVEVLLRAGANPNLSTSTGQTPLHVAAKMENFSCVRALLKSTDIGDHPNWINKADHSGNTVLHDLMASYNQNQGGNGTTSSSIASTIQYVVSLGGDITIENKLDQSPISICCDTHLKRILYRSLAEYQTNAEANIQSQYRPVKMNNVEVSSRGSMQEISYK